ncbi:hypothetical protein Peur_069452 [Populus x canadensis]
MEKNFTSQNGVLLITRARKGTNSATLKSLSKNRGFMSSGFDLLTGAPKKLCFWLSLHTLCISICLFNSFYMKTWSLQQSFLIISIRLRSKRNYSWVHCFKDSLGKRFLFPILGFRGFWILVFS